MARKPKWTAEEELVLTDQISKSANNISEAFRKTAKLIDRTELSCKIHWYKIVSKRDSTPVCFVTVGHKTKNLNRKNVSSKTSVNTERVSYGLWRRLVRLLFGG